MPGLAKNTGGSSGGVSTQPIRIFTGSAQHGVARAIRSPTKNTPSIFMA